MFNNTPKKHTRILWFTWKDITHPHSGGAEVVTHELAKRLVADGHQVTLITSSYPNSKPQDTIDNYQVIRLGSRLSVYLRAYFYYKKHLQGKADLVIEEINTIPFFTKFYIKEKSYLFIHQLARQIWFHEMIFPLSLIGYLLEPLYLRLLKNQKVITVSESSKKDLIKFGFKQNNIQIISEGITIEPVDQLPETSSKSSLLYFGSLRSMKRPDHVIKAFELIKSIPLERSVIPMKMGIQSEESGSRITRLPNGQELGMTKEKAEENGGTAYFDKLSMTNNLKLIIAGSAKNAYGEKVLQMIERSPHKDSITFIDSPSEAQKKQLMQQADLLCVTSIKEGWGLVVTEANSQGTPAVVYDVDGLRDSVINGETGIVCGQNTPAHLAQNIVRLFNNPEEYQRLRLNAWNWSKTITFNRSYNEFKKIIF